VREGSLSTVERPWSAGRVGSGNGRDDPKRDGCKAQAYALPVGESQTMRRRKPRRGRSVIENIKRVSLTGSISTRTKALKTNRKTWRWISREV